MGGWPFFLLLRMLFLNFLIGAIVNFIGYVPLGNVNLTVVQLTVNRGAKAAMYFIVSFSVVEFFFTYTIMYFADWFAAQQRFLYWLDWILIFVFLILGFLSWFNHQKAREVNYSLKDSVRYGLILGVVNPMQIPFWMIGGTYLISNGWVETGNGALAVFSAGAAIGSFFCLLAFAEFSSYLNKRFAFSSKVINRSIAVVFFLLAGYHVIKLTVGS
ncbi:Threonine/homoserine/homoserine lactone efflux protein [Daejeonella lutea]|uniref:Threonine/homoserine/homoserine lactone efflux protein n=2 Tax=Daejeonella lutea TaxID=572036 RepID=A0A1T5EQ22_9SPHI|nr:Threonine/homoserine/homoserine lactone efflux protein [Daejeonella lutea]